MRFFIFSVFLFCRLIATCQNPINSIDIDSLMHRDEQLGILSWKMLNEQKEEDRKNASEKFEILLIETLKYDNSFYFPFDSLLTVSKITSSDNKIRLFTWNFISDSLNHYNSGILMINQGNNTYQTIILKDKKKQNIHLFDYEELNENNWFGGIYYGIFEFIYKGKLHYGLLGYDGASGEIDRKFIDVISINNEQNIVFGIPVFYKSKSDYEPQYRVVFECAQNGGMTLRYEPTKKQLIYSHLVPVRPEDQGINYYAINDGTYGYYKFVKKKKWIRYEDLKDYNFNKNNNDIYFEDPRKSVPKVQE